MLGFSPALAGLQRSMAQFDQAASNINKATLPGAGNQDTVSLSDAAVALIQSRNSFDANTKVIKTVDQMDQTLLNAIG
jgi:flagellar hook protein FlgE